MVVAIAHSSTHLDARIKGLELGNKGDIGEGLLRSPSSILVGSVALGTGF
jgi:hypothetical protein